MWVYKYLSVSLFLIGVGEILLYPEVKLLDHSGTVMFLETTTLVSIVVTPRTIPPRVRRQSGSPTPPITHLLSFLSTATLVVTDWHLTVLVICISLMIRILSEYSCVYWPCVSLLSRHVYLKACGYFLIVFSLGGQCYCKSSFYILDNISLLSNICFTNIFSHSVCCLFSL